MRERPCIDQRLHRQPPPLTRFLRPRQDRDAFASGDSARATRLQDIAQSIADEDAAVRGSLRAHLARLNSEAAAELRELDSRLAAALGSAIGLLRDQELPNATADAGARLGGVRQRLAGAEDEQERSAAALGAAVAGIRSNRTRLTDLEDAEVEELERALAEGLQQALASAADTAAAVRASDAGVLRNLSAAKADVVADQVRGASLVMIVAAAAAAAAAAADAVVLVALVGVVVNSHAHAHALSCSRSSLSLPPSLPPSLPLSPSLSLSLSL